MKTVYTTYKIDLLDPDHLDEVDPKDYWAPVERITQVNGKEILHEMLDEEGNVHSWIETTYDDSGNVLEMKEWTKGDTVPTKQEIRKYDDQHRLVREESWFAGELADTTDHIYDTNGRLAEKIFREEGDEDEITRYRYNIGSDQCHTEEYWTGSEKWKEINYLYESIRGKWELIEERVTVLNQLDDSRIVRHFYHGAGPNNVASRIYNRFENLIEEIREFYDRKEQLIRREYHTSDSSFSTPYQTEILEYNAEGVADVSTTITKEVITHHTKEWYDAKGRVVRTHSQLQNESVMYFHVYED